MLIDSEDRLQDCSKKSSHLNHFERNNSSRNDDKGSFPRG